MIDTIELGGSDRLSSNIIVTGSHLFVSDRTTTYAADLRRQGYPVVWTAPQGGDLTITPDNLLTISARDGLYTYRLAN